MSVNRWYEYSNSLMYAYSRATKIKQKQWMHRDNFNLIDEFQGTQILCEELNSLSGRIDKVGCTVDPCCGWGCTDLYYARGAMGVLPMTVSGATSQLDLSTLTPLTVAGCGRLQLGVPIGLLQ